MAPTFWHARALYTGPRGERVLITKGNFYFPVIGPVSSHTVALLTPLITEHRPSLELILLDNRLKGSEGHARIWHWFGIFCVFDILGH